MKVTYVKSDPGCSMSALLGIIIISEDLANLLTPRSIVRSSVFVPSLVEDKADCTLAK